MVSDLNNCYFIFSDALVSTVMSTNHSDSFSASTISYFSSFELAAAICIAAPSGGNGKYLYSNFSSNAQSTYGVNSYARGAWGTSMAAPMVSGGLALIKQEFSSLSNAAVVDRLFATALDTGEYSKSTIYGHGLMNLSAATAAIGSLQTINGSNLLDDANTSYNDLVDNSFTSSAAFSKSLQFIR